MTAHHPHRRGPSQQGRTVALRWVPALLVAAALAACGASTDASEAPRPGPGTENRSALAADAARYVELQLDRAESTRR